MDHPRSRGDHLTDPCSEGRVMGSPPLTRGPRPVYVRNLVDDGITPAHAGTTHRKRAYCKRRKDHPRSRGDHTARVRTLRHSPGSPPLTRGPLPFDPSLAHLQGITPAHAGTTSSLRPVWDPIRDHPRSRGDHVAIPLLVEEAIGSPPLTRGPRPDRNRLSSITRITPAHAGTT